ncbi:MAG: MmpS family transport accessory protein [Anaerolineales bacterium]
MDQGSSNRRSLFIQIIVLINILLFGGWYLYKMGVLRMYSPNDHLVTYRLLGSASTAQVSYTLSNGKPSELTVVSVPWRVTVKISKGTVVILTAGNPTQTGDLGCELLLDGKEWKQNFAKSPEDKVSCAGIVP